MNSTGYSMTANRERAPMIRPEQPDDIGAMHAVNCAAFPTRAEADLVNGRLF